MKQTIKTLLLLLGFSFHAFAACHTVSVSGAGSKTGADWNNSYAGPPATLVRGDIYYFADGTYGSYTFSQAVSGTLTVEFRKAQSYDNCTSTGWNTPTMGSSQAIFTSGGNALVVDANYFTLNGNGISTASGCGGAPGSTVTASPPTPSDCGFKLVGTGTANTVIELEGTTNTTLSYTELVGSGTNNTSNYEMFNGGGGLLLNYSYWHNSGTVFMQDLGSNTTVDHSYFWGTEVNGATGGAHGQAEYETGGYNNGIRSNNVYRDITGTAVWTFGQTGTTNNNWEFYNNTVFYSSSQASWQPSTSDAALDCINSNTCTNFTFVQNTIINCPNPSTTALGVSGCGLGWGDSTSGGSLTIENNLYYGNYSGTIGLTTNGTTVTSDYNSFLNSGSGFGSGTHDVHVTSGAPNPFVNWPSSNFNLASDNADWNNRLALSSPYTVDVNGATFTTDRGAYQYESGASNFDALQGIVGRGLILQ